MAQTFTNHTYYKVYDGSTWKIISFKTAYSDVALPTDGSVMFLKPGTHTVNGQSFSATEGITLTGSNISSGYTVPSTTTNSYLAGIADGAYRGASPDIDSAISLLDAGIKAAFDNVPSGVLTTSNYPSTLGSVYQAKFTDGSATIASVSSSDVVTLKAGVAQSSGAISNSSGNDITLAKVAKTGSYNDLSNKPTIPSAVTESTVSGWGFTKNAGTVTGSSLTSDKIVVGNGGGAIKVSSYTITDLKNIAEGKTASYVINIGVTYDGSLPSGYSNKNDSLNSNNNSIDLSSYTSSGLFVCDGGGSYIKISDLKVGDVLFLTNTEIPDRWYAGNGFFYKLETTKVDLSSYATQAWVGQQGYLTSSSLSGYATQAWVGQQGYVTLTTFNNALSGYSTTSHTHTTTLASTDDSSTVNLAYNTKYKLTAGETSVVFKMPASDNTDTWRAIKVAGTEKIANNANTALDFVNTGNVTFSYASGIKASVDLSSYITNNRITITTTNTAPSSPKTNDIWLDGSA